MWRISVYIISMMLVFSSLPLTGLSQDTIQFPLKFRLGFEVLGPAKYFNNKDLLNIEGSLSADLNEKLSAIIIAGHTDYSYPRYRDTAFLMYDYRTKGFYFRAGFDINLLKPQKSQGKYAIGIGIRYGISHFNYEIPTITRENYWGSSVTSVPPADEWAHYIEITPGVRAEVFKNISMGWTVSLRKLVDAGTGRHLKPVYLPGYGNGSRSFSPSFNYFIIWSIPFKNKRIIIQPEPEEEEDDTGINQNPDNMNQGGFRQQNLR
ncbi:MAG TPA: DUF6048 family protein [Bacteroidales bacterium]|nr:DUF6048 family protein [Bacteroidales bacterium]